MRGGGRGDLAVGGWEGGEACDSANHAGDEAEGEGLEGDVEAAALGVRKLGRSIGGDGDGDDGGVERLHMVGKRLESFGVRAATLVEEGNGFIVVEEVCFVEGALAGRAGPRRGGTGLCWEQRDQTKEQVGRVSSGTHRPQLEEKRSRPR